MAVAQHQRTPALHVVDIAFAVGIEDMRAFATRKEHRRAAHLAEGADRGVDAAGNRLLGAGKQVFGAAHAGCPRLNRAANSRARAAMSSAENRSWMTPTASAPAAISRGALSTVTPPMATTG